MKRAERSFDPMRIGLGVGCRAAVAQAEVQAGHSRPKLGNMS